MWVFYKNDGVKQKKQVLSVKQVESYAQADAIALTKRTSSSFVNEGKLIATVERVWALPPVENQNNHKNLINKVFE